MPIDRVITAAVELVDQVGPAEFSMRMLAQHLRSSTATLYRNFASKTRSWSTSSTMCSARSRQSHRHGHRIDVARTAHRHGPRPVPDIEATPERNPAPGQPHTARPKRSGSQGSRHRHAAVQRASPRHRRPGVHGFRPLRGGFASQLRASEPDQGQADEIRTFYRTLDPARFPATVTSAEYMPTALDEVYPGAARSARMARGCGLPVIAASAVATACRSALM